MKFWKPAAAFLLLAIILLEPQSAVNGAQKAMYMWAHSVAPALFPFLALMPVLTGPDACAAYRRLFSKIMGKLFSLPGQAAPAVIIGMISGSPGGAYAVRRIAAQGGMSRADACRVALSVCGVSPAYLILGVGQGLYGSAKMGVQLALIQASVQIAMLILLRGSFTGRNAGVSYMIENNLPNPMRAAVESILCVCGYMVLFSSTAAATARWIGKDAGRCLLLVADLPSGLAELSKWNIRSNIFMLGGAIGFGGLCIAAQNMDILKTIGVNTGEYLAAKMISAALVSAAAGLIIRPETAWTGGNTKITLACYAFSLLAAMIFMVPTLKKISNTFFLNIRKDAKDEMEIT